MPQDLSSKEHKSASHPRENSAGSLAVKLAETSNVPVSMVRHLRKASNGDILIASYLGVFRYDGSSFTNLTKKISPPRFSSFWDVLEDRKGNLWFGTRDSGVYHYNGKSFEHFTIENGLSSNTALHFYEDRAGNIWIGSSRYDGKTPPSRQAAFQHLTTRDGFPSNNIRLLLEDKSGKLWFGAQGENLFVYDEKSFTVLKDKDGRAFNNVWSVIEDKKGNIWFGAGGLWRYDGKTFTKVSQTGAYAIIEDKKGNIWTTGQGKINNSDIANVWALSRYDSKTLYSNNPTVTEIMSQAGMLLGILEDAKGNIWFGSGSGVYRYDGKTITDFRRKEDQK